jgi:nitroreductase
MPDTMDQRTMLEALRLANLAPSVHNTQPWRWLVGDHSVHLMAEWSRQVPATDPDGRDLLVSCGTALHHLRIALASLGWHATVHRLPDSDLSHLAAIEVVPQEPSEDELALALAIPRRRTDRRGFTSWPVPSGHLDLMSRYAAEAGAMLVPLIDPVHRRVVTAAIAAASWWPEEDRGELAASAPGRTRVRVFPGGPLDQPDTGPGDDGELLVLGTQHDDEPARLRAGEAASAALLAATSLDLATCPLSQPMAVRDTRDVIRDRVLHGTACPQLLLRVGWVPTSEEPLPRSVRRPLHETFTYLPGARPRHGDR